MQRPGATTATRSGSGGTVGGRRPRERYLEALSSVRRQRVQTSALVGEPFTSMTSGWRFGCMRRWARTRFMPDDCGLKPPIEALPQIAQERAMRILRDGVRWRRAGRSARAGRYDSTALPAAPPGRQRPTIARAAPDLAPAGRTQPAWPSVRHPADPSSPVAPSPTSSAPRPSGRTASPAFAGGPIARLLAGSGSPSRASTIRLEDGIEIDLDLTVALGVPVAEVARQVDSAVRYAVRTALGRRSAGSSSTSTASTCQPTVRRPVETRPPLPTGIRPRDLADSGTDVA